MSKTFSQADVTSHNKTDSLWIVVDGDVYDLTKFQDEHPGEKRSGIQLRPTVPSL
jgi:cytochrome b involved in lipid metabolism